MVSLETHVELTPVFARPSVGLPRCSSGRTLGIYRPQVLRNSSCRGALIAVSGNDIGALERNCGKCIAALLEL
jgi:hypothetical protein